MEDLLVYGGITEHTRDAFDNVFAKIRDVVDGVHVDIVDGMFAPNTLLSLDELPLMTKPFAEVHLMVHDPLKYFTVAAQKGFRKVIVHRRSLPEPSDRMMSILVESARALSMFVYVALELGEEELSPTIATYVDGITVMGVPLGFSGGTFDPRSLDTLQQLSETYPGLFIEFDGGVKDTTIKEIISRGAREVVSTSWLSGSIHVQERYLTLKQS